MNIAFHGAARSVTGSRHLLQTSSAQVLLDCGMFQGNRQEAERRNRNLGFDPRAVNAVLLSHAHIDHCGALPVLARHRFSGKVYLTGGTADLARVLLEDSARIQENDCTYVNKEERRRGKQCRAPFYDADDVEDIARRFVGVRYQDDIAVHPRITASFHDAGHILGSAAIRVVVTERGGTKTVLFTGDLGRKHMPVLRDPASPPPCDVLIIESTYGDRVHEAVTAAQEQKIIELVTHARAHKSKIIVPAFAVGRTQEVVMRIKELVRGGKIEPFPIFID